MIPSSSNQFGQEIVNKVFIVPFDGEIEQEPFTGGWWSQNSKHLYLFHPEMNRQLRISKIELLDFEETIDLAQ